MSADYILLHLSLIPSIGSMTIHKILHKVSIDKVDTLCSFSIQDFKNLGISNQRAIALVDGLKDQSLVDKELEIMKQNNISWISFASNQYPMLLKNIEYPPIILYYQGANLFADPYKISFVGARKANFYVKSVLDKLLPGLVSSNMTIVSGGALGTDGFAHEKTVQLGGKTIVVLGSGLCHWYPSVHKALFQKIINAGGMIISSFSCQTRPSPGNFPVRNRIISGLSSGVVVVQAAEKSGSLITAYFALEQGRDVFAVPGDINSDMQVGCHKLIQNGAKLVFSDDDILSEMHIEKVQVDFAENDQQDVSDDLLHLIHKPVSTDALLSKVEYDADELNNKLFDLSLEGKIEQDMMGLWKRI